MSSEKTNHVYQLTCENKTVILLRMQWLDEHIAIQTMPAIIPDDCKENYIVWRREVVNPHIYSFLSEDEIQQLKEAGFENL